MAHIRDLDDRFAVAPQLEPDEVPALAGRFTTLINNRPDGEEPGQPTAAAMAAAADAAGLAYQHIPVYGAPTADQVRAVQAAAAGSAGPVLAFCRSGTRSAVAWALGEMLNGRPIDELTAAGARAGYDLAPPLASLGPRLQR